MGHGAQGAAMSNTELFPLPDEPSAAPARGGNGVLPFQAIVAMIRAREVTAVPAIDPAQIQPASMDLRLGRYAYRVRASFLPGAQSSVADKIRQMDGYPPLDLSEGA